MPVTIRQLTDSLSAQDQQDLQRLLAEYPIPIELGLPAIPRLPPLPWLYYAAQFNQRITALLIASIHPQYWALDYLAVRHTNQRRGIGSYLYTQVDHCAQTQGTRLSLPATCSALTCLSPSKRLNQ